MRRFRAGILIWLLWGIVFATPVFADYVLPYPSFMPGSKLYRVSQFVDLVKKYWSWGSIASFSYHLAQADKYLVEAKVLFEYKQYLLAHESLKKSNTEIQLLPTFLVRAEQERKDIRLERRKLQEAMTVHETVLKKLQSELPSSFTWQPERDQSTVIPIAKLLDEAIILRKSIAVTP